MRLLDISIGQSRFDTNWKNKRTSWEDLKKHLAKTERTKETMLEYSQMSKDRQDKVKDHGGFVGGKVNGRRRNGNILSRSIITLDLDNAHKDFWTEFIFDNDYAACIYSTHKHKPESPRLRLVIPLSRDVSAEEYEAISRKIAEQIGMSQFDDTTYQPARLMYWPTTSRDAEFVFEEQEGKWLNPDKVLGLYADWKNIGEWPMSDSERQRRRAGGKKKADDPTNKKGLVGYFCKAYTLSEAIEAFLSEIYVPVTQDRYTYIGGSTSAGLVVYDDLWAYSNHATDPASMQLCNAYDLVRIHKFGELDESMKEGTPVGKRPSDKAMSDFVLNDEKTIAVMNQEILESSVSDFATVVAEESTDWMKQLIRTPRGQLDTRIENFYLILANDPNLKNIGGYNEFNYRYECFGPLPWNEEKEFGSVWDDSDDAGLRMYLEKVYNLYAKDKCFDAVNLILQEHAFHPVRDYLSSLSWDGEKRLDTILIDYLGAQDTAYVRAVTRKTVTAAVKRIFEPGCKFDYMLTLIGKQGMGKSTLIRKLGQRWFSDTLITVNGKDAYDALHGVWIIEMSELTATRKADIESVKQFISKQVDTYRQAYARRTTAVPRQCIFIGTTNDNEFLKDYTGNRRYWPVEVGAYEAELDVFSLGQETIDQILAEAVEAYKKGESLYLSKDLNDEATKVQERHYEADSRRGVIEEYLNKLLPENWEEMNVFERRVFLNGDEIQDASKEGIVERKQVCALEILCECLGYNRDKIKKIDTREINQIMESIPGWRRVDSPRRFGKMYGNQRGFCKE